MQGTHPATGGITALAQLGNIALVLVGAVLLIVFLITERRALHHDRSVMSESVKVS
ncbi:hypothetical protein EDF27_1470 [Curtobacterium sp. PhB136]|nr:hypothetical protein EDF27_1470 [Curtobacterium sp. PhB136]